MTSPSHDQPQQTSSLAPAQVAAKLDGLLGSQSIHLEEVIQKNFEANVQKNKDYTLEESNKEVYGVVHSPVGEEEVLARIQRLRKSGIVSRATQMATLKGMVLDYENGIYKKGLTAITVVKALELLNSMGGYHEPIKVEHNHEHEHEVHVFPVVEAPFKGELEPLDVIDIDPDLKRVEAKPPEQQALPPKHIQESEGLSPGGSSDLNDDEDW